MGIPSSDQTRWEGFWARWGGAWLLAIIMAVGGVWVGYFGLTQPFLSFIGAAGVKAIAGTLLWTGVGLVAGIPLLMYVALAAIDRWGPEKWTHLKEATRWGRLGSVVAVAVAIALVAASVSVTWPILLAVAVGVPLLFFVGRWMIPGIYSYVSKKQNLQSLVEEINNRNLSIVASQWTLNKYGANATLDQWGEFLLTMARANRFGWVSVLLEFKPDLVKTELTEKDYILHLIQALKISIDPSSNLPRYEEIEYWKNFAVSNKYCGLQYFFEGLIKARPQHNQADLPASGDGGMFNRNLGDDDPQSSSSLSAPSPGGQSGEVEPTFYNFSNKPIDDVIHDFQDEHNEIHLRNLLPLEGLDPVHYPALLPYLVNRNQIEAVKHIVSHRNYTSITEERREAAYQSATSETMKKMLVIGHLDEDGIDSMAADGYTALHRAILSSDDWRVKHLLDLGASLELKSNSLRHMNQTPLMLANTLAESINKNAIIRLLDSKQEERSRPDIEPGNDPEVASSGAAPAPVPLHDSTHGQDNKPASVVTFPVRSQSSWLFFYWSKVTMSAQEQAWVRKVNDNNVSNDDLRLDPLDPLKGINPVCYPAVFVSLTRRGYFLAWVQIRCMGDLNQLSDDSKVRDAAAAYDERFNELPILDRDYVLACQLAFKDGHLRMHGTFDAVSDFCENNPSEAIRGVLASGLVERGEAQAFHDDDFIRSAQAKALYQEMLVPLANGEYIDALKHIVGSEEYSTIPEAIRKEAIRILEAHNEPYWRMLGVINEPPPPSKQPAGSKLRLLDDLIKSMKGGHVADHPSKSSP